MTVHIGVPHPPPPPEHKCSIQLPAEVLFPYRTMFFLRSRCRHNFALAFCVVYSIRRSQSNETEPKINRSQSNPIGRIVVRVP